MYVSVFSREKRASLCPSEYLCVSLYVYIHRQTCKNTITHHCIHQCIHQCIHPQGVRVPEVLQPFMGGMKLMPFKNPKPVTKESKGKKKKASQQQKK